MPLKKELIHKYTRRKKNHDYYAPCRYHIIIRKADDAPDFGKLVYNPDLPLNNYKDADIRLNKLGRVIMKNCFDFEKNCPTLHMYQFKVMPNHLHMFLWVKERTNKHLGDYISFFKGNIAKVYSEICGEKISHADIFQENYTDKIVYVTRDFNVLYQYIKENPLRLAIIKSDSKSFERKGGFTLDDTEFESYGCQFLLGNPFKIPVHVAHDATEEEFHEYMETCLEHVAEGGVLVSPFVSPREKQIRDLALEMGGRIIRLRNEPFTENYKPYRKDFYLCSAGKFLEIAPVISFGKLSKPVSRRMNKIAEAISSWDFSTKAIPRTLCRGIAQNP